MNDKKLEEMELKNRELLATLDSKLLNLCNNIVDIFITPPTTKKQLLFGIKNLNFKMEK
jgi:hypothetical protein